MIARMSALSDPQPLGILARWYADPLTAEQARLLLAEAEARQQRLARRGAVCRTCLLMRLIARFWLGKEVEPDYQRARLRLARTAHGRLLAEQIDGQLLLARRISGGFERLQRAFSDGHRLYRAPDYFVVFKRLETLHWLPLSDLPSPPAPLDELLTTARVIATLRRGERPAFTFDPNDTYG